VRELQFDELDKLRQIVPKQSAHIFNQYDLRPDFALCAKNLRKKIPLIGMRTMLPTD
jgi:hypothetical protein